MPLFRSTASLPALVSVCRALRHGLSAGIHITRLLHNQANRGPQEMRAKLEEVAVDLEAGQTLEDALDRHRDYFPALFRDLVGVGERTGHLPEIFGELEEYYSLQHQLLRQFYSQITWPVFQFVVAVGVIAFTIWILGAIAQTRGGEPIEPIGMGLSGAKGAVTFLVSVAVFLAGLFLAYKVLTRGFRQRSAFEAFLLKVPVVGPCAEAFAMGRFCIALRMTLETGMSASSALRQTVRATANAAFGAYEDAMVAVVKGGGEFSEALRVCPHFPLELLEAVAVGEESGQIPEVMVRQAAYWREEASRRLKALTRGAAGAVWLGVAILIIIAIFRIASIYFGALNQAAGL